MGSVTVNSASAESETSSHWCCPNCDQAASSEFCPNCGGKKPNRHDLSIRHMLAHSIESILHLDSKIFKTLWALLAKPGQLSDEFSQGCRTRHTSPLHLFLGINLVFFFLLPVIGWNTLTTPLSVHLYGSLYQNMAQHLVAKRIASKHILPEEFTLEFDREASLHAKSLVISMVPVLALLIWLLESNKRKYYVEHLVFSLHFYAMFLVILMVCNSCADLVFRFLQHEKIKLSAAATDHSVSAVILPLLAVYLFIGLRRYYRETIALAVLKAIALSLATVFILQLYRFFLFFTALYSV